MLGKLINQSIIFSKNSVFELFCCIRQLTNNIYFLKSNLHKNNTSFSFTSFIHSFLHIFTIFANLTSSMTHPSPVFKSLMRWCFGYQRRISWILFFHLQYSLPVSQEYNYTMKAYMPLEKAWFSTVLCHGRCINITLLTTLSTFQLSSTYLRKLFTLNG